MKRRDLHWFESNHFEQNLQRNDVDNAMKLGVSYMVFDGSELLEFAIAAIRKQVDFVSVIYQTTSYFGNQADQELVPTVTRLEKEGLIDKLVLAQPDLTVHHKVNELLFRNMGLQLSRDAGCTHHIGADVDEFYEGRHLEFAKNFLDDKSFDFSIIHQEVYYKDPTWMVTPNQKMMMPFIQPVDNDFHPVDKYPFHVEPTKRCLRNSSYFLLKKEDVICHHMSYVRKDIRRKFANSDNGRFYKKIDQFVSDFDKYQLGGRICILPDFLNRKTKLAENIFDINLSR